MFELPKEGQDELLHKMCKIAEEAGKIALEWQGKGEVEYKEDENGRKSPVTIGDRKANEYIVQELWKLGIDKPIISEEGKNRNIEKAQRFWLVDPVDGTTSYANGGKSWTVNIALVDKHRAKLGVVYDPSHKVMYAGEVGCGAWKIKDGKPAVAIHTRDQPPDGITLITSHAHRGKEEATLGKLTIAERISVPSSIKFCRIAEGEADVYPRSGDTMEWDTAAGQAIVEAAGGIMRTYSDELFLYGKPGFKNPYFRVFGKIATMIQAGFGFGIYNTDTPLLNPGRR